MHSCSNKNFGKIDYYWYIQPNAFRIEGRRDLKIKEGSLTGGKVSPRNDAKIILVQFERMDWLSKFIALNLKILVCFNHYIPLSVSITENPRFLCRRFCDTIWQKNITFENFLLFNMDERALLSKFWRAQTSENSWDFAKWYLKVAVLLIYHSIISISKDVQ